jgi:TPR repeat protein
MYENGRGIPNNDREAARWYRKAAEQGNSWAQQKLGSLYREGRGVTQNAVNAYAWQT